MTTPDQLRALLSGHAKLFQSLTGLAAAPEVGSETFLSPSVADVEGARTRLNERLKDLEREKKEVVARIAAENEQIKADLASLKEPLAHAREAEREQAALEAGDEKHR